MRSRQISMNDLPEGIVICDKNGDILAANDAFLKLFGYEEDELLGRKIEILVPPRFSRHSKLRDNYLANPITRPLGKTRQIFGLRKDGSEFPMDISLKPIRSGDEIICFARDISEHVGVSERIRRAAYHDPVTGVPNRHAFSEELPAILAGQHSADMGICIALFDIDHFKDINDTLGHSAGDEVLVALCDRLSNITDKATRIYRIGGDEFVLVMPGCANRESAVSFIEMAMAHIRSPMFIAGRELSIGCSAGIVYAPEDGTDAEALIGNADLALYKAKGIRGTSSAYHPRLRDAAQERFALMSELSAACDEGQFVLHFQPQIDMRRGEIIGAEALLRWEHPEKGLLYPAAFIDQLSESEISVSIGQWSLSEACAAARQWKSEAGRPIQVAVNLFPCHSRAQSLLEDLDAALSRSGLEPELLELELTENTIVDSSSRFIGKLNAIREMGVSVALDDFGTGYASLTTLMSYPIGTIKVDQSFVRDVGKGRGNRAVLRALAMLSRELDFKSVAEGVETTADELIVRHFGFDFGQGYHWGKPMPANVFLDLLKSPRLERAEQPSRGVPDEEFARMDEVLKQMFSGDIWQRNG
jgi:diguanylate cyclase (GGDEF)-like protein/PAS domain S-box-containing protein